MIHTERWEIFRVDAGILWETVQQELPLLKRLLQTFVLDA